MGARTKQESDRRDKPIGAMGRRDFMRLSALGVAGLGISSMTAKRMAKAASEVPEQSTPDVSVRVDDVIESERGDYGVVVLRDDAERYLPIWVGRFEAGSIRAGLDGSIPPRPMTYDFIVNVLTTAEIKIEQVAITQLEQMTFYAVLYLRVGDERRIVDTRPSDALAVAVRASAPIVVSAHVMETAGVARKDLEQLDPPHWA